MSLLTLFLVFLATFTLTATLLFWSYITDFYHWVRYRPRQEKALLGQDMRGRTAIVEDISEDGKAVFVRLDAERWRASCDKMESMAFKVGECVRVNGIDGLTLKIRPVEKR